MKREELTNFIKFLGTAGARFVVTTQTRASGGIWISLDNVNILLDPGPGSLVKVLSSKPKLDPKKLDAIFVSHRHIDHSNDTSIMIEAMTQGGKQKKGILIATKDLLQEGAIYPHSLEYLSKPPVIIKENESYEIKNIKLETPIRHLHPVETYGCIIENDKIKIGYIADTEFFPKLIEVYKCNIIIINVVLVEQVSGVQHLSIGDAKLIINSIDANVFILTHFGMRMLQAKPWEIADNLAKEYNKKVIAASDGMMFNLENLFY